MADEHRPPRARTRGRRARRREGHQPVHRAEVPGQRRTARSARATTRTACSIEHKLGIKASPTAVLQFGDHGGAVGYLVGQENRGLEYMFIMMNAARYAVGVQGIARGRARLPEGGGVRAASACSRARSTARCRAARRSSTTPTCKRMLMTMRAYTEGCRAMAIVAAAAFDAAHHHPDAEVRTAEPGLLRVHGAAGEGLQHRDEPGGREPGRAGARRHGLHRGDRRRAVLPRRDAS